MNFVLRSQAALPIQQDTIGFDFFYQIHSVLTHRNYVQGVSDRAL